MSFWLAIIVGVLYSAGIYMMMRRSVVKLIIGLALLSHAANLLIFTGAGIVREKAPIISKFQETVSNNADPLPQALVLTAIVISFGVLAFALVLTHRAVESVGTDDLDQMKETDT